jgi:hypothetical protein
MKVEWVTSVREQCERAGIAFFFKQWGGARKKLAGRTLDGRTYSGFPARPKVRILPDPERAIHIQQYSSIPTIDVPVEALSA